jgi:hypothetical protein
MRPLFTPTANGKAYDIQPAGVLILLSNHIHDPESGLGDGARAALQRHVDAILRAARAGGFKQSDVLETLLARCEVSLRVKSMAIEACEAAGHEAIAKIFDKMRDK